jgi:hypothetical protein
MCAGQPEGPAAIPGPQRQRGDGLHSQCAKIAESDRLLPASRSVSLLFLDRVRLLLASKLLYDFQ